ncbi:MAG: hopanoid biosynthesis associated radical SAM protein HpnH, partial [Rhodoplanes sp.]
TAANAVLAHPLHALKVAVIGVRTEGEMAPEIPLDNHRPAQYVFSRHVERKIAELHAQDKDKPDEHRAAAE